MQQCQFNNRDVSRGAVGKQAESGVEDTLAEECNVDNNARSVRAGCGVVKADAGRMTLGGKRECPVSVRKPLGRRMEKSLGSLLVENLRQQKLSES